MPAHLALPVECPHFPDRLHAFIWRNWPLVEPARLARVLGTSADNVAAIAESMGLPPAQPIPPEPKYPRESRRFTSDTLRARGYVTVLRRNWHLLPYEQLLTLLDMAPEQLAYSLREDDFLFVKLGLLKPACPPLLYAPPSEPVRTRAAEIRRTVQETFGDEIRQRAGKSDPEKRSRRSTDSHRLAQMKRRAKPGVEPRGTEFGLRLLFTPIGTPWLRSSICENL